MNESSVFVDQTLITSTKHRLVTTTQTKRALCSYDDKRYLTDIVNTRAHGHYLNVLV